jgi:hypothetical protein
MNNRDKNRTKKKLDNQEIERIFEATWENWASRRACEKTHTPKFFQKKDKKDKNNIY